MSQRAILFVDGSNWYHSLRRNSVGAPAELDYARISSKLAGPRQWIETRYYIGALNQSLDPAGYAAQRRFLDRLRDDDRRIRILLGRLEPRPQQNPLAAELRRWIDAWKGDGDSAARASLCALADAYSNLSILKEKAVDIMLAVDLVRLAIEDRFDTAYLLSADGDFTPAVDAVRASGRTVYAASPDLGYALRRSVNTYIHLKKAWFQDCYRTQPRRS
jgi:uncharacterized LabA/DUF88 family protein